MTTKRSTSSTERPKWWTTGVLPEVTTSAVSETTKPLSEMTTGEPSGVYTTGKPSGVYTTGEPSGVYTTGKPSGVYTTGEPSGVYTTGEPSGVYTTGKPSEMTTGEPSGVYTTGKPSGVYTTGKPSEVTTGKLISTTTEPSAPGTEPTAPYPCEGKWTEWMNSFYPNVVSGGDFETLDNLRKKYDFCGPEMITNIQCRVDSRLELDYTKAGQDVTCDIHQGLVCENSKQRGFLPFCYDYKVRVFCECGGETTSKPEEGTTRLTETEAPETTTEPSVAAQTTKPMPATTLRVCSDECTCEIGCEDELDACTRLSGCDDLCTCADPAAIRVKGRCALDPPAEKCAPATTPVSPLETTETPCKYGAEYTDERTCQLCSCVGGAYTCQSICDEVCAEDEDLVQMKGVCCYCQPKSMSTTLSPTVETTPVAPIVETTPSVQTTTTAPSTTTLHVSPPACLCMIGCTENQLLLPTELPAQCQPDPACAQYYCPEGSVRDDRAGSSLCLVYEECETRTCEYQGVSYEPGQSYWKGSCVLCNCEEETGQEQCLYNQCRLTEEDCNMRGETLLQADNICCQCVPITTTVVPSTVSPTEAYSTVLPHITTTVIPSTVSPTEVFSTVLPYTTTVFSTGRPATTAEPEACSVTCHCEADCGRTCAPVEACGDSCSCKDGYTLVDGACIAQPSGCVATTSEPSAETTAVMPTTLAFCARSCHCQAGCEKGCVPSAVCSDVCECKPGYSREDGVCIQYPANCPEPIATTKKPTAKTEAPLATTKQPTETESPFATTKQPTETAEPIATTKQPTETAEPIATTKQPTETAEPSATTKKPTAETEPAFTGAPETTVGHVTTKKPGESSTEPSAPEATSVIPEGETTSAYLHRTTGKPLGLTTARPEAETEPEATTSSLFETIASTLMSFTTASPEEEPTTAEWRKVTTGLPSEVTTEAEAVHTTGEPSSESTAEPYGTTAATGELTTKISMEKTTGYAQATTKKTFEETTGEPSSETTSEPSGTTAEPAEATTGAQKPSELTTKAEAETTAKPATTEIPIVCLTSCHCEKTCESDCEAELCGAECSCQAGYVRMGGICVQLPQDCEVTPEPTSSPVTTPEAFTTPGVCAEACHCVQTCEDGCQAARCEAGCTCAAGFSREFGMCVQKPAQECTVSTTSAPKKQTTAQPEISTEKPSLYTTQEPSVYTTGPVWEQTTGASTTAETYTTLPACPAACTCTRTCEGDLDCPSSYNADLCAVCSCAEGRRNSSYCVVQDSCDCVYGGMDYNVPRPNNVWTEGSCTVCRCLNGTKDCHVSCNIDSCQEGYMLVDNDEDECCRCVPNKCEYQGKYYAYGETWLPDTCMSCTCTQDGGVVCDNRMQQCDMECDESYGTLKYTDGQCCPVCEPHPPQGSCKPTYSNTTLELGECVSTAPIRMSTCSGRCSSTARVMLEPPYLEMDCSCCKPTRLRREVAQLSCADNSIIEQPYYVIEACGCEGCDYDPFSAATYTTAKAFVGK